MLVVPHYAVVLTCMDGLHRHEKQMAVKSMKLARSQVDRDKALAKCSGLEKRVRELRNELTTAQAELQTQSTLVQQYEVRLVQACRGCDSTTDDHTRTRADGNDTSSGSARRTRAANTPYREGVGGETG